jgi:N-acetylglucosamine repressor
MRIEYRKHDDASEQLNLLQIINRYGGITRRQIVDLTGFSQAKISLVVGELKRAGLVEEVDEAQSSGGRRAKLLQIRGERGRILGVEIGGSEIRYSLVDFRGRRLAVEKSPFPDDARGPAEVIAEVVSRIRRLSAPTPGSGPLAGLGVGLSGILDRGTGSCVYFRNQKSWEGFPLCAELERATGLVTTADDSSRMMAVAEHMLGCCRGIDNFILISVGVGTGSGIFIGGELFGGTNGYGGEFGHMVIKENGPRCVCGNQGCLESFVSGYAIERRLREAIDDGVYSSMMEQPGLTARDIITHAEGGDKLAFSIITDAARHLGIGIANAINIFNPRRVVLSGGVSGAGRLLLDPVVEVVRGSALSFSRASCDILLSTLDEYAAAIGAGMNWLARMLNDPRGARLILGGSA